MKTRLSIILFALAALFMSQKAEAQIILDNQSAFGLNVFVNDIPVGTCGFTGVGAPIHVPPFTVITLPGPAGWVVGYGVDNGTPPAIVGNPGCGYPPVIPFYGPGVRLEYHGNLLIMK